MGQHCGFSPLKTQQRPRQKIKSKSRFGRTSQELWESKGFCPLWALYGMLVEEFDALLTELLGIIPEDGFLNSRRRGGFHGWRS